MERKQGNCGENSRLEKERKGDNCQWSPVHSPCHILPGITWTSCTGSKHVSSLVLPSGSLPLPFALCGPSLSLQKKNISPANCPSYDMYIEENGPSGAALYLLIWVWESGNHDHRPLWARFEISLAKWCPKKGNGLWQHARILTVSY